MSDQDLMLLLANPKKLQRSGSTPVVGQSSTQQALQSIKETFQILEAKCVKDPMILSHPKEFANFINRNIPEIIQAFYRSLAQQP